MNTNQALAQVLAAAKAQRDAFRRELLSEMFTSRSVKVRADSLDEAFAKAVQP